MDKGNAHKGSATGAASAVSGDRTSDSAKLERPRQSRSRALTILGDDNFSNWKWDLKYNLKSLGLYECVTTKDYPDTDRDDEAMFEIIGTLSDKVKSKVSHCKRSYELYQTIETLYTNKTSFQATGLHMKLSSFKFKTTDAILEGFSEIQSIVSKLKNLGEAVSEHFVEGIILAALPSSFRTFVTVWKRTAQPDRTVENLMQAITAEIEDNKILNGRDRDDKALVAHSRGTKGRGRQNKSHRNSSNKNHKSSKSPEDSKNQSSSSKSNMTCNYCKKPGHFIKDCRKLKFKNKHNEQNQSSDHDRKKDGNNNNNKQVAFIATSIVCESKWIVDSGASRHMTSNFDWIQDYQEFEHPKDIYLGNNQTIQALGSGDIKAQDKSLENVYYVPQLSVNLFSIVAVTEKGIQVEYDKNMVKFFNDQDLVLTGYRDGNVYLIDFKIQAQNKNTAYIARSINDWHQRFGHVSAKVIKSMADSKIVNGLDIVKTQDEAVCEDCARNKGHAVPHPSRKSVKADLPGVSLHFDTVGKLNIPSLAGSVYFLLCKDEASAYRKTAFMESKADIPAAVKAIISESEYETKNKVLRICSDNGSEFVNHSLAEFLKERGIVHEASAAYVPQQNGFIERDIRTIVESARTMLNQAGLPKKLWAEAVNTAVYILNRVPTTKRPDITPFEAWYGQKPDVKNLRIFGQEAVVNRPLRYRDGKWDNTGDTMRMVGYTDRTNTYRFYCAEKNKVIISCDATFLDHNRTPEISHDSDQDSHLIIERTVSSNQHDVPSADDSSSDTIIYGQKTPEHCVCPPEDNVVYDDPLDLMEQGTSTNSTQSTVEEPSTPEIPRNLFIRNRPPPILSRRLRQRTTTYYGEDADDNQTCQHHAKISTIEAEDDPTSYKEAISRKDGAQWRKAMKEEIDSLHKNQVWKLVDRPKNTNIVTNRWVLRIKRKPNGSVERYRARLVARGFSQVHGIDYNETYAPVVNMTSVRMLFAFAAIQCLQIKQFDVKTAFLYGKLDEEVFMEQPEGFEDNTGRVCRLEKSLYGLKQAPRQWNKEFSNYLKSLGLQESQHDRCIYYRIYPTMLFIAIYVDDGIIVAQDVKLIVEIIIELKKRFDIHEVESTTFLGFQIEFSPNGSISLHQESYIHKILKQYNMANAHPIDNPSSSSRNSKDELESKPLDAMVPYREAVGSLMYASGTTRVDLAYAVNKVSRHVAEPTTYDWKCVKRIFRYLREKENACITFHRGAKNELVAFCDADFAGDETCKSTTGYVILFGGGPIQWKSQKQSIVTLSSTEAELVSMCSLVKEIVWIRQLAQELGFINSEPTKIYCDNESAIRLANNEKSVQRTRHMGVRAAFTREQAESEEIIIEHVKTEHQAADFLTKALPSKKFTWNFNRLMSFLAILFSLCFCVQAVQFEEIKPIIWAPTNNFVDTGVTNYEIDLTIRNPCESLERDFLPNVRDRLEDGQPLPTHQHIQQALNQIPMAQIPHPGPHQVPMQPPPMMQQPVQMQNFPGNQPMVEQPIVALEMPPDTADIITKHMVSECNMMWNQIFITKYNELLSRPANKRRDMYHVKNRGISKRSSIIGNIAEKAVGAACGLCVTNLIYTLFSRLYPHSDHNRIISSEERIRALELQNQEFDKRFNITYEINKGILDTLVVLSRTEREQNRQFLHLAELMPRVSWVSSFMQSRITTRGSDMREIIQEYSYGRVATREMSSLLNLTALEGVENEDTFFESVTRINPSTVRFKFSITEKSRDTFVYKVIPFNYWENLTDLPTLMEYRGAKFLVFNETSNCMKSIEEPSQRAVGETCRDPQYIDPQLQVWQPLISTRDIYANKHTCQVRKTVMYHYIYCFPFNITLKSGTYRTPPYPFRLATNVGFEVPTRKYEPEVKRIEIINELPVIDSVNLGHFPQASEVKDDAKWFDTIQRLRRENEELLSIQNSSVTVTKHGVVWWMCIWFVILTLIVTIGLVMYNLYLSEKASKHNKRIEAGIYELKSEYQEIKIDCPKCNRPKEAPPAISSNKAKSRIEVGRDESITINLNRPLPVPVAGPSKRDSL